jgi:hypothetical protein
MYIYIISVDNTNKNIKDEYIKNKHEYLNSNTNENTNNISNSRTFNDTKNVSTDSTNQNNDINMIFNKQLRLFSQPSHFKMPVSTLPTTDSSPQKPDWGTPTDSNLSKHHHNAGGFKNPHISSILEGTTTSIDKTMTKNSYLNISNNDTNDSNYMDNNQNSNDKINKSLIQAFMDCEKPSSEIFQKYLENKENFNNNSVSTDFNVMARTSDIDKKFAPQTPILQGVKTRTPTIHVPSMKSSVRTDHDNIVRTVRTDHDNEQSSMLTPSLYIPKPSTAPNHPYLKNKIISNDIKNTKILNIPSYDARHGSFSRK